MSTFILTIVYDDPVLLPLKDAPTVEQRHDNDVPLVPKAQLLGALDILGHLLAWKQSWQQRRQWLLRMMCMIFTYSWIFGVVFDKQSCISCTLVDVNAQRIQKCLLTNFDWQIFASFHRTKATCQKMQKQKGARHNRQMIHTNGEDHLQGWLGSTMTYLNKDLSWSGH